MDNKQIFITHLGNTVTAEIDYKDGQFVIQAVADGAQVDTGLIIKIDPIALLEKLSPKLPTWAQGLVTVLEKALEPTAPKAVAV